MEEKKIRVYQTHIEISPYERGENPKLEKMLSLWVDAEYRYDDIAYHIENDTIYIPRGIDLYQISKLFDSTPFVCHITDKYKSISSYKMLFPPKNDTQAKAINYLTAKDEYSKMSSYAQQALTLDTGVGKTFVTINSILNMKIRAIIITHQDKVKNQWIDTFKEKTNVPESKLINIEGSKMIDDIIMGKVEGQFYFINHQTINSYARTYGWLAIKKLFERLNVGIKVFDEAHLSFKNVLRIDFFSNTAKTFYITATFGRSEPKEEALFKKCFASVAKFNSEDMNPDDKRKHIIYVPTLYRSNPNSFDIKLISTKYGFSVIRFIQYALHRDRENNMMRSFYHVFDMAMKLEGKILVTVPRIQDVEFIKEKIIENFFDISNSNEVGEIHSERTPEENEEAKSCRVICSTIKSCGTAVDIKGLRVVINLEPFSSDITCNQLSGRLREYAKDKDTYFFDLIDIGFDQCVRQHKKKINTLSKKCKSIQILRL